MAPMLGPDGDEVLAPRVQEDCFALSDAALWKFGRRAESLRAIHQAVDSALQYA